jgi:hypothetical protein
LRALAAINHIISIFISKGHHFLIALLLFFLTSSAVASTPVKLDSLSAKQVWFAAQVLPGSGQVINKQYWKVPAFYAGMGSMLYFGLQANTKYHDLRDEFRKPIYGPEEEFRFKEKWMAYKVERNIMYAGAAAFYVASVADAMIVKTKGKHSPITATIFSALVPGMGQVYNQKLWKVPVVFGGIAALYYVIDFNQRGYKRFGDAYKQYPNDEFGGRWSETELIYLRDAYRRNRDLSIIGFFGLYVLNIIDANVDAHFFDWDISDDLAFKVEPVFNGGFSSYNQYSEPSVGLRFSYKF